MRPVSARSAVNSRSSRLPRMGMARVAVALLLCAISSPRAGVAQSTKKADAPVTCATCHHGVISSYAIAPMRHAMEPQGANPALEAHPSLTTQIGPYTYRVETKNGQSTYTVSDGTDTLSLPVHWIFGQNSQTWVLEKDGHFYESFVSYFPRANGLAITPGDQKLKPTNLTEAMGRLLPIWETRTCFNCHGTGVTPGEKLVPAKVKPGLDCEHCHVGSQQHMADAAQDNFKIAANIAQASGCRAGFDLLWAVSSHLGSVMTQQVDMGLHSCVSSLIASRTSRCFIGNDRRISCLACHNPHQPLNHSVAYYDSKCLACHAESRAASAGALQRRSVRSRNQIAPAATCRRWNCPVVMRSSPIISFALFTRARRIPTDARSCITRTGPYSHLYLRNSASVMADSLPSRIDCRVNSR